MKACLWFEQLARTPPRLQFSRAVLLHTAPQRALTTTSSRAEAGNKSYKLASANLDHNVTSEEKRQFERELAKNKEKSIRSPWHREGSDKPPVEEKPSKADVMTKGKLLTTPSRLLKLILPLRAHHQASDDDKPAQPLALLVHPQQPLSYLERLIQAELPMLDEGDKARPPTINFSAEGSTEDSMATPREPGRKDHDNADGAAARAIDDSGKDDGVVQQKSRTSAGVETYSGLGREAEHDKHSQGEFMRWSKSTEMGDFIRDAARGKEFAVEIEGAPKEIRVAVPSFGDRTYYLRLRLRKRAREIATMADVKKECDMIAHKSAQHIAMAGLGGLLGWSVIVGWLTFKTKLGWDVMEPVTYLVGLIGIIIGYSWFLWHNREVSYRSAMNLTVSTRQNKLYQSKGFDLHTWQMAIDDANALRREIIAVANEYDVEWDEKKDTQYDKVIDALRESREKKKGKEKSKDDDGDGKEDDD